MKRLEITNSQSFKNKSPSNSRYIHCSPDGSHLVLLKAHMGGGVRRKQQQQWSWEDPGPEKERCLPRAQAGVAAVSVLKCLLG